MRLKELEADQSIAHYAFRKRNKWTTEKIEFINPREKEEVHKPRSLLPGKKDALPCLKANKPSLPLVRPPCHNQWRLNTLSWGMLGFGKSPFFYRT